MNCNINIYESFSLEDSSELGLVLLGRDLLLELLLLPQEPVQDVLGDEPDEHAGEVHEGEAEEEAERAAEGGHDRVEVVQDELAALLDVDVVEVHVEEGPVVGLARLGDAAELGLVLDLVAGPEASVLAVGLDDLAVDEVVGEPDLAGGVAGALVPAEELEVGVVAEELAALLDQGPRSEIEGWGRLKTELLPVLK